MAKNNQPNPNLRAATVARVNQLLKTGLSKAGAFEKISAETGRAKDAVQMLYYRAMRATAAAKPAVAQAAPKPASGSAGKAAPKVAPKPAPKPVTKAAPAAIAPVAAAPAAPAPKPSRRRRRSRRASARTAPRAAGVAQSGEFPTLLNGIASAINALLKHVEKTVEENKTLKQQADRLKAITSLIRGR